MTGWQRVGEGRVAQHRLRADVLAATLAHLDVGGHDLDHLRQLEDGEARLDLILERPHEELLTGVSVEIGVGVTEADEVERLRAVQPLIARPQVDLRVAALARAAAVVEVAPVDVHPDAVDLVDELPEAPEIDRDDVVDRDAGQVANGLDCSPRAARRVRGVDPVDERGPARATNLHLQVARERQHRDRLAVGVGPHEHQRVGARRGVCTVLLPPVVADDEGCRRLAGERHLERLERLLHLDRPRSDGRHRLVEVEIRTTCGATREHGEHERRPAGDSQDEGASGTRWRPAADRSQRAQTLRPRCRRRPGVPHRGRVLASVSSAWRVTARDRAGSANGSPPTGGRRYESVAIRRVARRGTRSRRASPR